MKVHFIIGGDAQRQKPYYEGFEFPGGGEMLDKILGAIKKIRFPRLSPLCLNENTPIHHLPTIVCCACQYYALPTRRTFEETLTLTHIHSSMRADYGLNRGKKNYLFCNYCASDILEILKEAQRIIPDVENARIKALGLGDPRKIDER
jgi:hypothetical protein